MDQTQVVTVRGLRKSYGGRTVVDGVDLDVRAGEIVGLVGANGAGKTTTVECVQGLRKPDGGTLRVLSFDPVTQVSQVRARLGSQLQSSALPDRLRVGEAVRLFSGRAGDELIEQFGLAERRRVCFRVTERRRASTPLRSAGPCQPPEPGGTRRADPGT